jgi:hypothetical protein
MLVGADLVKGEIRLIEPAKLGVAQRQRDRIASAAD